ncbi:AcrR family transcriptional regulator [Nocardioides cavernae]|uniref:AcrR family transcriptional regulator n=1 Tax=Nocardioides cavernae TaxID=1921566 RepID=A0A7Y9H1A4_9ACTN|nr:TetR family transcriptional regulator [Nocardioides cavernae]NYE36142.1 AcrR family transcriptional regulator [Nocardioides cavernae]
MPRDASDTVRRILDAAVQEFAQHGIAGSRVDRIAAAARINKAQLYAHVGNKDALFDAAFAHHVDALLDAVPLTAEDLPGYAGRLYDAYVDDPALMRLVTWARLERTPEGDLFTDADHDESKLDAISAAQAAGVLDRGYEPADLWALLVSMAATWAQAAVMTTATRDEAADVHQRRRAALARAVDRAFSASRSPVE